MQERAANPEHSLVTILAVDTVGSTDHIAGLDPDDAEIFLDKVMAFVSARIEAAGGVLASFHGDGGLAIFGWPNSLEDHADCACEAAWAIQHPEIPFRVSNSPVEFRLGIHSGLVRFRQLRLGVGSNLDLVGATVHMAAALQKLASPGGILVSGNTRELCAHDGNLEPVGDATVQKKLGTPVFELLSQPVKQTSDSSLAAYPFPIVGRIGEREQIAEQFGKRDGSARVLTVIGEPGIGKSRLVSAIVDDRPTYGRKAYVYRGDLRKSKTPFAAMKALVLAALDRGESKEGLLTEPDLADAGISKEEIAKLGPLLTLRDGSRHSRGGGLTGKVISRALVSVFSDLTAGEQTLAVVEDLQLIDPESVECLRTFAELEESRNISLLITGRPEAEFEARRIAPEVLFLRPLGPADMVTLAEKLRPEVVDPSTIQQVLKQADGVPFVLEQMLLSFDPDHPERNTLLPQSVESLIHGRLNKLSNAGKALAQAASVFGEETETELAARVIGSRVEDLQSSIKELQELGLIYPGRARLRFRHSIIAEACATQVPRDRQRSFHSRAIDAISSLYANLDEHYERIAFHAECAGDDENALEYLWLAGLQARRSSATASLLLIFQRAEECIQRIGEAANDRYVDFVLMAGAALVQIGEFTRMKEHIPRALEIAREQDQSEKVCGALCHLGMISWFDGDYRQGLEANEEALTLARELDLVPSIFAAMLSLANIHHSMGNLDRALELQSQLCAMFEGDLEGARLGATGMPSSMAHAFMGWFLVEVGQYDRAENHARTALELANRYSDSYAEVLALNSLGAVLLALNRPAEAVDHVLTAKDLAEREGYDAILPHVTGRLAAGLARIGRADQAVSLVEELLMRIDDHRTGRLEMFNLHIGFGEALRLLGRDDEAQSTFDYVVQIARDLDNPTMMVQALGARASIEPDSPSAKRDLSEQRRLCTEFGLVSWAPVQDGRKPPRSLQ